MHPTLHPDRAWTRPNPSAPLRTCDAVLSEACFLLRHTHGGVRQLLALVARGIVTLDFDLRAELAAVAESMRRYENIPMSLAGACVVRMSQLFEDSVVYTVDRKDFSLYRRRGRQPVPCKFPQ